MSFGVDVSRKLRSPTILHPSKHFPFKHIWFKSSFGSIHSSYHLKCLRWPFPHSGHQLFDFDRIFVGRNWMGPRFGGFATPAGAWIGLDQGSVWVKRWYMARVYLYLYIYIHLYLNVHMVISDNYWILISCHVLDQSLACLQAANVCQ